MRSKHQKRVDEFSRLADQEVPSSPCVPSEEIRRLRCRLILEEAMETINALGFNICINNEIILNDNDLDTKKINFQMHANGPDLIEIADGCADLIVVTTGTLTACGIDDQELQEEVDNNNLAKFGPGSYRRDDGKWIKPPDHQPPRIADILQNQSKE